jgi:pimeloyl-ACP methyl ester carboxylesterase
VAVVEQLGVDDVVLVGHSMGGDVVVEAAVRLGERVSGVVWVDVYRSFGAPHTHAELDEIVDSFSTDFASATADFVRGLFPPDADAALVEWVVADMSAAAPEIALDALRHAIGHDRFIRERLGELAVPVVAINPDYRPTDVDGLRREGVEPLLMSGVGHFLMLEDPTQFNGVLGDVVEEMAR